MTTESNTRSKTASRARLTKAVLGPFQVVVMNSDRSHLVTANIENCQHNRSSWSPDGARVTWSPDGTRIALSCRDSYIHIFDPADGKQTSLWACRGPTSTPAWSPDVTRIAFTCHWSRYEDLHVIDIGSGDVTGLTFEERHAMHPAWSPDGTKIAFASDRDGDYEIYVLDLERAP